MDKEEKIGKIDHISSIYQVSGVVDTASGFDGRLDEKLSKYHENR